MKVLIISGLLAAAGLTTAVYYGSWTFPGNHPVSEELSLDPAELRAVEQGLHDLLRGACATEPELDGVVVARVELDQGRVTLRGLLTRSEQANHLEARAVQLLDQIPNATKHAAGGVTARLHPFTLDGPTLARLQQHLAQGGGADEPRGPCQRTRLDGAAIAADGTLRFGGVCVHGRDDDTRQAVGDGIRAALLALGLAADDLPAISLDITFLDDLATTLRQSLAADPELDGAHLTSAYFDATGGLEIQGTVRDERQRGRLKDRVLIALARVGDKLEPPQGGDKGKEPKLSFDEFDSKKAADRVQADLAAALGEANQVRIDEVTPSITGKGDARKRSLQFKGTVFATPEKSAAKIREEIKPVLGKIVSAINNPLKFEIELKFDAETLKEGKNPIYVLQEQAVEQELDGVLFDRAWYDANRKLTVLCRLGSKDRGGQSQQERVRALLQNTLKSEPWELKADAAHLDPKGKEIEWRDVLRGVQQRLANAGEEKTRRARLDRAFFTYNPKGKPVVVCQGVYFARNPADEKFASAGGLQGVLLVAFGEAVQLPKQATTIPSATKFPVEQSPIFALQQEAAEAKLDGTLFLDANFDADRNLVLVGRYGKPTHRTALAPLVKQFVEANPSLQPAAKPLGEKFVEGHALNGEAERLPWDEVLARCQKQLAGAVKQPDCRTRLDRAFFKWKADKAGTLLQLVCDVVHVQVEDKSPKRGVDQQLVEAFLGVLNDAGLTKSGLRVVLGPEYKELPNPVYELQRSLQGNPDLDGVLIAQVRYDARGALEVVGRADTPQKDLLTEALTQFAAAPKWRPLAREQGARFSAAGLSPHLPKQKGDNATLWQDVVKSARQRFAADPQFKQTRLDRAYFTYKDAGTNPVLSWEGVSLVRAGEKAPGKATLEDKLKAHFAAHIDLTLATPPEGAEKVIATFHTAFQAEESPVYDLQEKAVKRELHGLLFKDAYYTGEGKLTLEGAQGAESQNDNIPQLLKEVDKSGSIQGRFGLESPRATMTLLNWQKLLDDVQKDFASGAVTPPPRTWLYPQTCVDQMWFQRPKRTDKEKLYVKGVCFFDDPGDHTKKLADKITELLKQEKLDGYDLSLDELKFRENPVYKLQDLAKAQKLAGVLFEQAWYSADRRLTFSGLRGSNEQLEAVRKLVDEFLKGEGKDVMRPPQGTAELKSMRPIEWREHLASLQGALAASEDLLARRTRVAGAYFQRRKGQAKPELHFEGANLHRPHATEDEVRKRLAVRFAELVDGVDYQPVVDQLVFRVVENPAYELQDRAALLNQQYKGKLDGLLFGEATFTAAGVLHLPVLLPRGADVPEVKALIAGIGSRPEISGPTAPATPTTPIDWEEVLKAGQVSLWRSGSAIHEASRLDRAWFDYKDHKALRLVTAGVCLCPTAQSPEDKSRAAIAGQFQGLVPSIVYAPVADDFVFRDSPVYRYQASANDLGHDGILFEKAAYDQAGKLWLHLVVATKEDRDRAAAIISGEPMSEPVVRTAADNQNEPKWRLFDRPAFLAEAQRRMAETAEPPAKAGQSSGTLFRRTRIDGAQFDYDAKTRERLVRFQGVSLEPTRAGEADLRKQLAGRLRVPVLSVQDVAYQPRANAIAFHPSPIFAYQREAVAGGVDGKKDLDGVLFADAYYDRGGQLHLRLLLGTAGHEKDVGAIIEKTPPAAPVAFPAAARRPVVIDELAVLNQPQLLATLQQSLARGPQPQSRTRADRLYFAYPDGAAGVSVHVEAVGLYAKPADKVVAQLELDLTAKTQALLPQGLVSEPAQVKLALLSLGNPVPPVQQAIGAPNTPSDLDGVRLDDAIFDDEGKLTFVGIWNDKGQQARLQALSIEVLKPESKLLTRGLNWERMRPGFADEVLAAMREWVAKQPDLEEVLIRRVYFDRDGQVKVEGTEANEGTNKAVRAGLLKLLERIPPRPARADEKPAPDPKELELTALTATAEPVEAARLQQPKGDPFALEAVGSIAGMLRRDIPKNPRYDGLRIDRCYYDPRTLEVVLSGLTDSATQAATLSDLVVPLQKKFGAQFPKGWRLDAGNFQPIPVRPMIDGLEDVMQDNPALDGIFLERAYHDEQNRLVFTGAIVVDKDGPAPPELTASVERLLKEWLDAHPRWGLRSAKGVVLQLGTVPRDLKLAGERVQQALDLLATPTPEAGAYQGGLRVCCGDRVVVRAHRDAEPAGGPEAKARQALKMLRVAVLHKPGDDLAWYLRGYCHTAIGKSALAQRDLRRMHLLEQAHPEYRQPRIVRLEHVQGPVRAATVRHADTAELQIGLGYRWTVLESAE